MENYLDYLPVEIQEEIYKMKQRAELQDVLNEMKNTIEHDFYQTRYDLYHVITYSNCIVEYIVGYEYDEYYNFHIDLSRRLKTRPARVNRVVYESKFSEQITELSKYKKGLRKINKLI